MSLHINRFVDIVKAHEARGQRDLVMPIRDAKDLHGDITKLLLAVTELQRQLLEQKQQEVIEVNLTAGKF
jgi:hypothetical protein